MRRGRQIRWSRLLIGVASAVVVILVVCLYALRFQLWRHHPNLRTILRPVLVGDPWLRRATRSEIQMLLGAPDVVEGRYCWFPGELRRSTGDLRFEIGSTNQITGIHFLWRDWNAKREVPMDLERWKDSTEEERWAMNADLVRRWPRGDFRGRIDDVHDVLRYFPGTVFIEYWQYASDGRGGLGGSLDFEFDAEGAIRKVRTGYID